ncbi:MAG: 6-pyruvoyl-tetrahydropterin synthase-related protein, partial [Nannocystaceae bacterium]
MASPGSRLPAWAPRLDPTLLRTLLGALPWLAVTGLALALLWPVPTGRMPLSADHTVHLTRISMLADELAAGRLRGWSRAWFFGTPVGELYPVLGDLIIIGLRGLSFGSLSWPQAYAVGFSLVFTVQGWAMLRTGRAMGLGPLPGLVAALLVLADVGAYREGGWIYTVFYGVWPQALATALTWLALAELAVACEAQDPTLARRRVATGALAMGAALLAHPMALMSFAIGGPLLVLTLGMRSHAALRRSTAVAGIGGLLGVAVAAWWVVPMLQHRGWMASYGWMWQPLERMAAQVAEGHWTQGMPTAVGVTAGLGLLLLAIFGDRPARLLAGFGVLQWLLASREALWDLRLDQLSEGFAHIQYQRFLITAKPGLFLAAGAAVALPVRAAAKLWSGSRDGGSRGPWARPLAVLLAGASMGLAGWMAVQQRDVCIEREVGKLQLQRVPGDAEFDREYAALLDWMRQQHAADRDQGVPPYRATVVAARNLHWFMDAPALTGMPIYKQGFTPGDNFVHKPEAGTEALLDALRVRYVITTGRRGSRGAREVARFGRIRVLERPDWDTQPVAWLQGPGTLEVLEDHVDGGVVRVRVSGAGEGTRVVFGVAGFPRWSLEHDGVPVEWIEVPVIGDGPSATQAQRRGTELRGGKAHGDDGSEPTLIAADVGDGELTLRYHPRRGTDVLMGVLS